MLKARVKIIRNLLAKSTKYFLRCVLMNVKKKLLTLGLSAVFLLLAVVTAAAYSNGKAVVDEPAVQWVSHTEYWSSGGVGSGEVASTIVRLTDYRGAAFNVDSCDATILYPNKTAYISGAGLIQSAISGNWYRNDTIPDVEGTYEQEVVCAYGNGKEVRTSQSFHVNPALNFIKNVSAQVLTNGLALSDVNLTLLGKIEGTNQSILTQIVASETSLDALIDTVNASLSQQLTDAEENLTSYLTGVNVSLNARIGTSQTAIQTQLTDVNNSLTALLNTINSDLSNYLQLYLPALNETTTNIYSDSQWLVANAMNQEDAADIDNRFNRLDGNVSLVEQFCLNTQTNSSGLCAELYEIGNVLDATRNEQTSYFTTLNQTTTNTWDLLSGDITTNINSLLSNVNLIKGQTTQINSTVDAIRSDQTTEVRIQAIA
jgi:hypothetical protein